MGTCSVSASVCACVLCVCVCVRMRVYFGSGDYYATEMIGQKP